MGLITGETKLLYLYHKEYFCNLEQGAHLSLTPTLSQKLGDRAAVFLDFKEMAPRSLGKMFLGHKAPTKLI